MTYLAFIPFDAKGDEHMTVVWVGNRWLPEWAQQLPAVNKHHCPFNATVYGHDIFQGKPVALLALPHRIHVCREGWASESRSELREWVPHITLVPGQARPIGSMVTFSHAEWRRTRAKQISCGGTADEMECACGCAADDSRCDYWLYCYENQKPVDVSHTCCTTGYPATDQGICPDASRAI